MLLLRFKVSVNLSTVNQSLLSLEFVDLHFKHLNKIWVVSTFVIFAKMLYKKSVINKNAAVIQF